MSETRLYGKLLFLSVFVLFMLAACGEEPKNPVAEYGNTLTDAYKRGQQAGETANLDAVRKAVQAYYALNGRYPHLMRLRGQSGLKWICQNTATTLRQGV